MGLDVAPGALERGGTAEADLAVLAMEAVGPGGMSRTMETQKTTGRTTSAPHGDRLSVAFLRSSSALGTPSRPIRLIEIRFKGLVDVTLPLSSSLP